MHRKVKEIITEKRRDLIVQEIEGRNGENLERPEDIRKRWIEYTEELYDKENKPKTSKWKRKMRLRKIQ